MKTRDISLREGIQKRNNRQDIFDALCYFEKVTAKELWKWLNFVKKDKKWRINSRKPLSLKTVQRYLKDPRVIKEGWNYRVNDKARFETKYLKPEDFALDMYHEFIGGKSLGVDKAEIMKEFVMDIGALMVFTFIEASRPFEDNSFSARDRNELVQYWVKNAFPTINLFFAFQAYFSEHDRTKRAGAKAPNEIDNLNLKKILEIFERAYPERYKNLLQARKQLVVFHKRENGKLACIHGKTYHSNYKDYLLYLREVNPLAYEFEYKTIQKNRSRRTFKK